MGFLRRLFGERTSHTGVSERAAFSGEIVMNCRKCGERYTLGKNAVVASIRQIAADVLGSGGVVRGDPSLSPDLIQHGKVNPAFRPIHDAQLEFLKRARSQGVTLSWRCGKCQGTRIPVVPG